MTAQIFDSIPPFMPESEGEVARQLLLHRKLNDSIGGPLPSVVDLEQVHRVLDVACGVGGWVGEMAKRYPSVQIVGIDRSAFFLEQARSYIGNKENVTLRVADMHRLEEQFAPQSFDLIHLRFLVGEVTCKRFPELLQSLVHLCRTGGFMVWTEAELPETNSQACCLLESALLCALLKADRAFWNGYSLRLGLTIWMETCDTLQLMSPGNPGFPHNTVTDAARVASLYKLLYSMPAYQPPGQIIHGCPVSFAYNLRFSLNGQLVKDLEIYTKGCSGGVTLDANDERSLTPAFWDALAATVNIPVDRLVSPEHYFCVVYHHPDCIKQ